MDLRPITNWIIVDLKQEEGRKLLKAALDQMVLNIFTLSVYKLLLVYMYACLSIFLTILRVMKV